MRCQMLVGLGLLLSLPLAARAQGTFSHVIDFDYDAAGLTVLDGTVINSTYTPEGVTFVGEGGAFARQVQVVNAAAARVGVVSIPNVLDATTNSGVDVSFSTAMYPKGINFFSINLLADPSGFGDPGAVVSFYDRSNVLLATQTLDQTADAFFFTNLTGIQKVVLPPDAFYDDLTFRGIAATAPEPGAIAAFGLGLAGLTGLRFRRHITRSR